MASPIHTVKGFFTVELLLVIYLLPYLVYLLDTSPPPLFRETEVLTQDAAQLMMYGVPPTELPLPRHMLWVDDQVHNSCSYSFRYCTSRHYDGGDHHICLAECSP